MTWLLALMLSANACPIKELRDAACGALCSQDSAVGGRWDQGDNTCVCEMKRDYQEMKAVRVRIKTFREADPPAATTHE